MGALSGSRVSKLKNKSKNRNIIFFFLFSAQDPDFDRL